jgi:DNA-binding transcriptional LysR family regulator
MKAQGPHSGPENLDLKLLRLLDLLYTTRSVTRTAERLAQSQPTVSIGLARLREVLQDPLFVRTPRGMQPTPRADALMPTVREVLQGLQRLAEANARFEPAISERDFRLFMTDASHITLMPQLAARLRAVAPKVALEAATIGPSMADQLQSGEADIALGFIPGLEAGFYQQALFDQDWICLCRHDHPRAGPSFDARRYAAEEHVGIVSGTGHGLLSAALQAAGMTRRERVRLPGFLGLSAILTTSDLIATLPRHIGETIARTAGLRVLPCPIPIPGFTVCQYWHARAHHDPGHRWLRAVCAELFLRPSRVPQPAAQALPR